MKRGITFLLLIIIATALASCGGAGTEGIEQRDFIDIKSVEPGSGLIDGTLTDFTVVVGYKLVSSVQGEIAIGFNNDTSPDVVVLVGGFERIVDSGTGEEQIDVSAVVKDWGSGGDFRIVAVLSRYPHPDQWTSLAHDDVVLTFQ